MSTRDSRSHSEPRDLRSFGRRRGRRLSARQARLYDDVLPEFAIDLTAAPPRDPRVLFPGTVDEVVIEVGFGAGEHLIASAYRRRDVGFIGCEPYIDGVIKVVSVLEEGGLENVRVYPDDVRPLLRWLPAKSLSGAFVLFPDPWPKKRHVKRRLVDSEFLALLSGVLKPGSELLVATDIPDYVRTILLAARNCPELEWEPRSAADWRDRPADWVTTKYEHKALREGRTATFLRFARN